MKRRENFSRLITGFTMPLATVLMALPCQLNAG
jgi:hypothetical protein